uniref:Uncharacterized protein n=1 Tax=Pristionchus pacificus TaxID=54126 RepID=A0A2A6BQ83_PRIPA
EEKPSTITTPRGRATNIKMDSRRRKSGKSNTTSIYRQIKGEELIQMLKNKIDKGDEDDQNKISQNNQKMRDANWDRIERHWKNVSENFSTLRVLSGRCMPW